MTTLIRFLAVSLISFIAGFATSVWADSLVERKEDDKDDG